MRADPRTGFRRLRINGYGVCSPIRILVGINHLREVKMGCEMWGHRGANQAGAVADQEGHLLGGDVWGGDDEVTFIFSGEVVEDDDEFAIF